MVTTTDICKTEVGYSLKAVCHSKNGQIRRETHTVAALAATANLNQMHETDIFSKSSSALFCFRSLILLHFQLNCIFRESQFKWILFYISTLHSHTHYITLHHTLHGHTMFLSLKKCIGYNSITEERHIIHCYDFNLLASHILTLFLDMRHSSFCKITRSRHTIHPSSCCWIKHH